MILNYKYEAKWILLGSPRVSASILVLSFFSVTKRRFSRVSLPLKFSHGRPPLVRYSSMLARPSRSSLRLYSKCLDVIWGRLTEESVRIQTRVFDGAHKLLLHRALDVPPRCRAKIVLREPEVHNIDTLGLLKLARRVIV